MIEQIIIKAKELLDYLATDFNLLPLLDTQYRDVFSEDNYNTLGEIKNWYTIDNFKLAEDIVTIGNKKYYKASIDIRIESESNKPNYKLNDLLIFLVDKRATKTYLGRKDIGLKTKIRNARTYDNRTLYFENRAIYKFALGFNLEFEFFIQGGENKWQ